MAFDQPTRNRLARFVGEARALLTGEFTRQLQHEYGLDPERGEVTELAKLTQLDDARRETARILRDTLAHYLAGQVAPTAKVRQEALDRLVREQAFTVLNRLCALRMAEARGLLIESIAKGYQSRGFQLYARLAGTALGETGEAYRAYLFSLFDEFAVDLAVLFDRFSPQGRLFPRASTLLQLLAAINHADLEPLWAEDETIGWIYQYFNSKEERKAMRDASQAPRNSRELAVRNQFFTPRYVVEFLTDNTLGRIWYEMTQGRTSLVDSCRYLVRRPNEIFLNEGEEAPTDKVTGGQGDQDLTQEELLRQPVYIPFRQIKDPRTILMLDPACGSMHFGLYSFDLYERIYEEAWELEGELGERAFQRPAAMAPLRERYPDKASFLRDVPRLIIEHNIHGIDIDPRAVQIAGLSLWLRAQKSWQVQGLKPQERPPIRKSNIVCAEPMPGDKALLEEFLQGLRADRLEALIRRVLNVPENQRVRATPTMADALCNLVRKVWEEMKLAGEAGSLLKIEEALTDAIAKGRAEWEEKMPLFRVETFRLTEERPSINYMTVFPGEEVDFWTKAETLVLAALQEYAELTQNSDDYQRRLFVEDASRGFAFIDICRKFYDIVVMNPPFGDVSNTSLTLLDDQLDSVGRDIGAAFLKAGSRRFAPNGIVGALLPTGFWFKPVFTKLRNEFFWGEHEGLSLAAHLGGQVLDGATVAASPIVVSAPSVIPSVIFKCLDHEDNEVALYEGVESIKCGQIKPWIFYLKPVFTSILPGKPFSYWLSKALRRQVSELKPFEGAGGTIKQGTATADEFRFCRAWWEVVAHSQFWSAFTKSGEFSPFWDEIPWVIKSRDNLREIEATGKARVQGVNFFGLGGVTFPRKAVIGFNPRLQPPGCNFGDSAPVAFPSQISPLALLALLASRPVEYLIGLFVGELQGEAGVYPLHYQVGVVQRLPWPKLTDSDCTNLSAAASQAVNALQEIESLSETSRLFQKLPITKSNKIIDICASHGTAESTAMKVVLNAREIGDAVAFSAYGFSDSDIEELKEAFSKLIPPATGKWRYYFGTVGSDVNEKDICHNLISWFIGQTVGRWDIRFATSEKTIIKLPDPFVPLPVCPPGMLQNDQGLPIMPKDVPVDYPVRISWSGILVDDSGHYEDIEGRVREVLPIIWPDSADAIEQEACEILGVASLRAYFANPNGFFNDHLKRYSKSRRVAPIYWPLSTPSGSYTLWLYYHRLTDQTLYSCVNDFVEPKLKQVNGDVDTLRRRTNRSRQEEKDLEQLSELALELAAFRDELLRIARFWQPNLNDGVQITAAPLWRLFQHRAWQKRLKETWTALEAGDYDWAHLAYSIWPDRVRAKCKTDKSLAIAHDLEYLYVEPAKPVKAKKGGGKKQVVDEDEQGELL